MDQLIKKVNEEKDFTTELGKPTMKLSPIGDGSKNPFTKAARGGAKASLKAKMRLLQFGKFASEKHQDSSALKAPRIIYRGHKKAVLSTAILAIEGKQDALIASGGDDRMVNVWSLKSGEKYASLKGHAARVASVKCFSPDGHSAYIVSGSWDESIRIWPVTSCYDFTEDPGSVDAAAIEKATKVLKGHKNRVYCVDVLKMDSEDSSSNNNDYYIFSGSADNTVRVWSFQSGEALFQLFDQNVTWVLTLKAFLSSIYGKVVITGNKDNTVRVWRVQKPQGSTPESTPARVITGHSSRLESLDVYHNHGDPVVITTCRDWTIRLFSLETGELLRNLDGHTSNINSVAVYETKTDGAIIASGSSNGNIRIWKFSSGEMLRVFSGHTLECNYVSAFETPDENRDLIILSCSGDCTVRTWLYAEERALTTIHMGVDAETRNKVRVKSLVVYAREEGGDPIIVTGNDDCSIRAFHVSRSLNTTNEIWRVEDHVLQVTSLALYDPPFFLEHSTSASWSGSFDEGVAAGAAAGAGTGGGSGARAPLNTPLVISGSRDTTLRVYDLFSGKFTGLSLQGHEDVVASVAVFNGWSPVPRDHEDAVMPFIVSGSEDNNARVWALHTGECIYQLEGHEFDVTSVAVYFPFAYYNERAKAMRRMEGFAANMGSTDRGAVGDRAALRHKLQQQPTGVSGGVSVAGAQSTGGVLGDLEGVNYYPEPLIVTGSMDNTIRIWEHPTGNEVKLLIDSKAHVTCVSVLDIRKAPLLAAGNGDNQVILWSMLPPFDKLRIFEGHKDEVQSVCMYDCEGLYPVLVSGSWDMTIRIWNLKSWKFIKTVEGHSAEVSGLSVFEPGGADAAVASCSSDSTVRILYDFSGSVMKEDVIKMAYQFDLTAANAHLLDEKTKWPRIQALIDQFGPEQFFAQNSWLFFQSLIVKRSDFIQNFLPMTRIGLVKSNQLSLEDGQRNSSLLREAILANDKAAVRTIVQCWVRFLNSVPVNDQDLLYETGAVLEMIDVLFLADEFPREFETLICGIHLAPARGNKPPNHAQYLMLVDEDLTLEKFVPKSEQREIKRTNTGLGGSIHGGSRRGKNRHQDSKPTAVDGGSPHSQKFSRIPSTDEDVLSTTNETVGGNKIVQKKHPIATKSLRVVPYAENEEDVEENNSDSAQPTDPLNELATDLPTDLPTDRPRDTVYISSLSSKKQDEADKNDDGNKGSSAVAVASNAAAFLKSGVKGSGANLLRASANVFHLPEIHVPDADNILHLMGLDDDEDRAMKFSWLPLKNPAHMEMLKACADTCETLDSTKIFDSEAGKLLLSFAWRSFGRKAHVRAMLQYCVYVGLSAWSIYIFEVLIDRQEVHTDIMVWVLIGALITYDAYFLYKESGEMRNHTREFFSDIWNQIDAVVIFTSLIGNSLRLTYWKETQASRVVLAMGSVAMWFNVLYYLRAFEATGPLVSMVLRIAQDMRALILLLLIVNMGFAQALWLLSSDGDVSDASSDSAFSTIDGSLLNSYSFMLGGFDPEAFEGLPLESFAIFLACMLMLFSSILLLNLLIALMGDSYGEVKEKGLAQWRLEQAQLIRELAPYLSEDELQCMRSIYVGRHADTAEMDLAGEDEGEADSLPATKEDLREEMQELKYLVMELAKRK